MQTTPKDVTKPRAIFNGEYKVMELLGEGKTARVYLCQHISDPSKKMALKLVRQEFLRSDQSAVASVEQEI